MENYDYDYGFDYQEPPKKVGAWVFLILATIVALANVYFWLPFYRACQGLDHNVLQAIKDYTKVFALHIVFMAGFFVLSTVSNVKFSRAKRFYGRSAGGIIGRIIILLEYAIYVFSVVLLFF